MVKKHADRTHLPPQVVAQQLGVAVESIQRAIKRGDLRAINIGSGLRPTWRIAKSDLDIYLAARANVATQRGSAP